MTTFLLSTVALLIGPLIYAWGRRRGAVRDVLDGFILVTIAGIVCAYIIPNAFAAGGRLSLLFLAIGLLFPIVIEKTFERAMHYAHTFVVVLAALGLVVHALIDGIALLPGIDSHGGDTGDGLFPSSSTVFDNKLALGVILHRIPIGMAIWWSVRPAFGTAAAIGTFALLIAATAAAFFFGTPVVEIAERSELAWFQAFVAGSLVHVVAFGVSHEHPDWRCRRRAASSGASAPASCSACSCCSRCRTCTSGSSGAGAGGTTAPEVNNRLLRARI